MLSPPPNMVKHGQTRANIRKHGSNTGKRAKANMSRTRVKHGQTRANTSKYVQTPQNTGKHGSNTGKHYQTRQLAIACVSCVSTCDLLAKPCCGYCISYLSWYLVVAMCFCKSCKHCHLHHNQFAGLYFLAHFLTTCSGYKHA